MGTAITWVLIPIFNGIDISKLQSSTYTTKYSIKDQRRHSVEASSFCGVAVVINYQVGTLIAHWPAAL